MEHQLAATPPAFPSTPGLRVEKRPQLLPEGVSPEEWDVERSQQQNPRIRCLLGCLNLIEAVLENDYTLLHCSPERLIDILSKVRAVGASVRDELAPLLQSGSHIPALDEALGIARASFEVLHGTALGYINNLPPIDNEEGVRELRKGLCVSMGQLHSFLQDNFLRIVASDPRSQHDIDYFLSKRFPRDVEESEWLFYSVSDLGKDLEESDRLRPLLEEIRALMQKNEMVPAPERWRPVASYLHWLIDELSPRLRGVLKLPGIRFDEMEVLEQYASDIPTRCQVLLELSALARQTCDKVKNGAGNSRPEREQTVRDLVTLHRDFGRRLGELLHSLGDSLRGLAVFVPFWLHSLEDRRSLILHQAASPEGGERSTE